MVSDEEWKNINDEIKRLKERSEGISEEEVEKIFSQKIQAAYGHTESILTGALRKQDEHIGTIDQLLAKESKERDEQIIQQTATIYEKMAKADSLRETSIIQSLSIELKKVYNTISSVEDRITPQLKEKHHVTSSKH